MAFRVGAVLGRRAACEGAGEAEGAGDKVVHALEQPLKLPVNDAVGHAELRALRDGTEEVLIDSEPLAHAVGE